MLVIKGNHQVKYAIKKHFGTDIVSSLMIFYGEKNQEIKFVQFNLSS